MKKFTLLSRTRARALLNLLPSTALMTLSIIFNNKVDTLVKLYPLIIFMGGITVFIALFLFRVIYISNEEIRMLGPFTSRDRAIIKKDTSLVLTLTEKGRVKVELFGEDDGEPVFDWVKEDGRELSPLCLFREKVYGGIPAMRRVLRFLDIGKDDIDRLLTEVECRVSCEGFDVSAVRDETSRILTVRFFETL